MSFERHMLTEMLKNNLEQGYEVLTETEDHDLAITHFLEAIEQAKQLMELAAQAKSLPPTKEQPTLDI